jgi:hypothetical protein
MIRAYLPQPVGAIGIGGRVGRPAAAQRDLMHIAAPSLASVLAARQISAGSRPWKS